MNKESEYGYFRPAIKSDDEIIDAFREFEPLNFLVKGLYVKSEDQFYYWENGVYEPYEDYQLKRQILTFLQELKSQRALGERFNINNRKVDDLYRLLKLAHVHARPDSHSTLVTFSDGKVLDMETFKVIDGAPGVYSFYSFKFPSSVLQKKPNPQRFGQFLDEVLVTKDGKPDSELKVFMQEVFGYALTSSTAAHTAFFFYGSGRNGKSVLLKVLSSMADPKYISNMTIQTLSRNPFAVSNLIGKRLNIAGEEESNYIKSDLFKSLVAGDPITADRKYRDPIEFTPTVKFIFATNEIPVFDSANTAIRERIKIIPFNRYIRKEDQDRSLVEKLKHESDEIFVWALEGAKRLVKNDFKFSIPQSVIKMGEVFSEEQSSALEFIKEECSITGNRRDWVSASVLYSDYKDWCEKNGRMPKSSKRFRKDLNDVFGEQLEFDARRMIGDTEVRAILGIRLIRLKI